VDELEKVLIKSLQYVIQLVGEKMAAKEGGISEKDIINKKVGIRLQQLAQLHAVYYMVHQFIHVICQEKE
jgi:hypothetical protein